MRSKPHWPLVAALLTAACSPREETAVSPPAPTAEAPAAPAPDAPWRIEASVTAGAALVYSDEDGVERLRIICRRRPAELVALAASVQPVGSEERFSLGVGDRIETLVADVTSGRPFVQAKGQLTEDAIAAIEKGPIAASYGSWTLPPKTPPKDVRSDFANACRRALRD